MNEQAGPACALSFLIIGVFAILLHEPTSPNSATIATYRKLQDHSQESPRSSQGTAKATPPAVQGPVGPSLGDPSETRQGATKPGENSSEVRNFAEAPASFEKTPPRTAPPNIDEGSTPQETTKKYSPPPNRAAFVLVQPGENLRTVATRVYGSPDATEELWRANRDRVSSVDSLLAPGMLLRSP